MTKSCVRFYSFHKLEVIIITAKTWSYLRFIVAPQGEGCGIGRTLMEKGEQWPPGFRWLTLSVFAQNLQAKEVYKQLGYGEDIMKYVKELT